MRPVLVGPPGAGKGTQVVILSEKSDVSHVSTGDLLRVNIGEDTPFDIETKSYIDAGNPVPGDVIVRTVESCLNEDDTAKGFLSDGSLCTVGQTGELKHLLPNLGIELDVVIQLDASEDVIIERMLVRGHIDDTEEVIHNRMYVYINETASLLNYYSEKIIKIAAEGSVEGINERAMVKLEKPS